MKIHREREPFPVDLMYHGKHKNASINLTLVSSTDSCNGMLRRYQDR